MLFAFGMFSVLGLSPFKGALSRFVVLFDLVDGGRWPLAIAGTLGSFIAVVYSIRLIQAVCFGSEDRSGLPSLRTEFLWMGLTGALGLLTAFMNFFGDAVAEVSMVLFKVHGHVPHAEGTWPWVVLVPYLGAFALFALGRYKGLRDAGAVGLALATVGLAAGSPDLDATSRVFASLFAALMLFATFYSTSFMRRDAGDRHFYFYFMLVLGSLMGLATSRDLGTFYVFWELLTWSGYFFVIHTGRPAALRAGARYFIMCVGGAYLMQLGIVAVAVYGGSFAFDNVGLALTSMPTSVAWLVAICFLVGLGVKAGLVPFQAWLPEADPAAPTHAAGAMSAVLTKAGFLGVLKILIPSLGAGAALTVAGNLSAGLLLSASGVLSLLYGEWQAWRQSDLKRLLAYSTMAQIGEIAAVLGLFSAFAVTASVAHIISHGIMKMLLWLAAGVAIFITGSRRVEDLAGLRDRAPWVSVAFAVGIFGILGLPPFIGFYSKFALVLAALDAGAWPVGAAILLGGFIAMLYYGRLARLVLFASGPTDAGRAPLAMVLPVVGLGALVLAFGLYPEPLFQISQTIAIEMGGGEYAPSWWQHLNVQWTWTTVVGAVGALVVLGAGGNQPKRAAVWSVVAVVATLATLTIEARAFDVLGLAAAGVVLVVGALNLIYSAGYFVHHGARVGRFMAMFLLMMVGLIGIAGASDLLTFLFFWELMSSWPLYVAIVHDESPTSLREGFKYFTVNMAGAALMFFGVGVLASGAGSLAIAELTTVPPRPLVVGAVFVLIGAAMKAAMLTLRVDYQMHPATAPTPVSGYISSVLLKSGPLAAFKLIHLVGAGALASAVGVLFRLDLLSLGLAVIGAVTAFIAALAAMLQTSMKRLLIYSTVAQLGYIMCALTLGDPLSVAGGLMHTVNHALLKNTLFLGAGAIIAQQHIDSLDQLGGAARRMPWTFAAFAVAGLSLAGVPPMNGFASKWLIYVGAMTSGHPFIALLLLGASLGTLAAVLKFIHAAFLGPVSEPSSRLREAPLEMLVPMVLLVAASVVLSFVPGVVLVPVAMVQASLGMTPVEVTLWGGLPGPYGWHPAALGLPLIGFFTLGWLLLARSPRRAVINHTCGEEIKPDRLRLGAGQLFQSPKKLLRSVQNLRGKA